MTTAIATCKPVRTSFRGMGTTLALALWPSAVRGTEAQAALKREVAFLHLAEALLSRFDPNSEISRLNRGAAGPIQVSSLTFDAIQVALHAAAATNGLFDPTVYRALLAAGYDRSFEVCDALSGFHPDPRSAMPSGALPPCPSGEVCDALSSRRPDPRSATLRGGSRPPAEHEPTPGRTVPWQAGRWRQVRLDAAARTVTLPAGVGLDLGGIAKGWLADRVADRLSRHGAALADLGGDIAVRGQPPDADAWYVDVEGPYGAPLGHLRLSGDGGVATSGVTRRRWRTASGVQHHLIDPRTGRPALTDLLAVTVVAPSAAQAEVAAKGALLLGSALGRTALAAAPVLGGVLVERDGRVTLVGEVDWSAAAPTPAEGEA